MKLLLAGDIHLPAQGPPAPAGSLPDGGYDFFVEGLSYSQVDALLALQEVFEAGLRQKVDAVCVLGDITDNHGRLSARQVTALTNLVRLYAQRYMEDGTKIYFLAGNHDIDEYGNVAIDFLNTIHGVEVISKPTLLPGRVYAVPESHPIIPPFDLSLILAHHEFIGGRIAPGLPPLSRGERIPGAPVFSGHLHLFHTVGCDMPETTLHEQGVVYIGASRQVSITEAGEIPKMCVVDLATREVKWLENKAAGRYAIHEDIDDPESWDPKDIHIIKTSTPIQDMERFPPRTRVIFEETPKRSGESEERTIEELKSSTDSLVEEAVHAFVDTVETTEEEQLLSYMIEKMRNVGGDE